MTPDLATPRAEPVTADARLPVQDQNEHALSAPSELILARSERKGEGNGGGSLPAIGRRGAAIRSDA